MDAASLGLAGIDVTGPAPGVGSAADPTSTTSGPGGTPPLPQGPTAPVLVVDSLGAIDRALRRVGSLRAELGAVENRLEHTVARPDVAFEDTPAAFSRIRDADMAMEMTALTRNRVLLHAGTAMLAQANHTPQGVLRLLA